MFFIAHLFRHPKNFKSTTIRNYVGHVRAMWTQMGCNVPVIDKQIITRMLRGLSALCPPGFDIRLAFLLPHLSLPSIFIHPRSVDHLLFEAAIVFDFSGMLRFSSFAKLSIHDIVPVGRSERETTLTIAYASLLYSNRLPGFYFTSSSKCHPNARAYYCSLNIKSLGQLYAPRQSFNI